MRFDLITLFPELFEAHVRHGITRRAYESGQMQLRLWPLRDFADDAYRRVDDRPYGGGPGMVLMAQPLLRALAAVRAERGEAAGRVPVVHFTPAGRRLDQTLVREFATGSGAVLVCGRYEGIDQRFIDAQVTDEISLGDFVLSGGEVPALALLDAVARLQPGVLSAPSHEQDSFGNGLLEGPQYSRPERLDEMEPRASVPPVLLCGDHARVARWQRERSLERTARRRPDLIAQARAQGHLDAADESFLRALEL